MVKKIIDHRSSSGKVFAKNSHRSSAADRLKKLSIIDPASEKLSQKKFSSIGSGRTIKKMIDHRSSSGKVLTKKIVVDLQRAYGYVSLPCARRTRRGGRVCVVRLLVLCTIGGRLWNGGFTTPRVQRRRLGRGRYKFTRLRTAEATHCSSRTESGAAERVT